MEDIASLFVSSQADKIASRRTTALESCDIEHVVFACTHLPECSRAALSLPPEYSQHLHAARALLCSYFQSMPMHISVALQRWYQSKRSASPSRELTLSRVGRH
jgi:hypothetical protein